jgi:hypothetical protein
MGKGWILSRLPGRVIAHAVRRDDRRKDSYQRQADDDYEADKTERVLADQFRGGTQPTSLRPEHDLFALGSQDPDRFASRHDQSL